MGTIALRVDDATSDELDAVARGRGLTRSDLLREAIDTILDRRTRRTYGGTPQSLTVVERKVLMMQHEILSRLPDRDEDDRDYHERMVTVLQNGFVAEYTDEFGYLDAELSREDCTLVMDVLDMFRVLHGSVMQLTSDERASLGDDLLRSAKFSGFDLNDRFEGNLLMYARYLIEQGKWSEQADRFTDEMDHGDSHWRTLPVYRRMLAVFQPIWADIVHGAGGRREAYVLTVDEVRRVVEASKYGA